MRKTERGITLIALVVTIVVLLILAGVSISLVLGDNGIINKAKETRIAQSHAQVKDAMAILYASYQTEMLTAQEGGTREVAKLASLEVAVTASENISFSDYLVSKGITDANGVVNVQKLLGGTTGFGNGTGTSDVYKIETQLGNYILNYYDKNGTKTLIDTYGGDVASVPVDKTALKFLVNSGEDGIVQLPIDRDKYGIDVGGYEVDWGDGTTGKDSTTEDIYYKGILHTYAEKNKEYTVTITGKCDEISNSYGYNYKDRIIEVLQWGETGLQNIGLYGCENLRKIASPTANSFANVTSFDESFNRCTGLTSIPTDLFANCPDVTDFRMTFKGCEKLTSIPANLFANCKNVENFSQTFEGCTSLTSIPENLFAKCPNVTDFRETFAGCTGLTGNAPELWERVLDGENNDYKGTPDGEGCFAGCKGLSNYEKIPAYWKEEPEDA